MARVRARDTGPEMLVRRTLHAMGYRFRVQHPIGRRRLDVAFTRRRRAVLVHGCFWHGHDCARGSRTPKANADYWRAKIDGNRARDAATSAALETEGWRVLTLWECGLGDPGALAANLGAFLGPPRAPEIAGPHARRRLGMRPSI